MLWGREGTTRSGLADIIGNFDKTDACGMVTKKSHLGMDLRKKMREQKRRQWVEINFMLFVIREQREPEVFLQFHCHPLPN